MILLLAKFQSDVPTPVHWEYNPKDLDLEFVDLKYQSDLVLDGTVEKGREALVFEGHLVTDVDHICGRCLKEVKEHIDEPFKLYYDIKDRDRIDTTEDLREILILKHPISFICGEDCRLPGGRKEDTTEKPMTYKGLSSLKQMWEKKKEEEEHGPS